MLVLAPKKSLLLLLVFSLACATSGGKGEGEAQHLWDYKKKFLNMFSVAQEIELGEKVMELQIKEFKKKKVATNPPQHRELKNRIDRVVKKLAKVSDMPDLPYEVYLFDKPDVANAFCLPGGKIGVFTGLFFSEKAFVDPKNENQIAAVMGHEIAHATMHHLARRITRLQAWGLLGNIASITIGESVGLQYQRIFEEIFSLGTTLYLPSYSRKYEAQADQVGFYYLSRAGYSPEAAIEIWKKAAEKGGRNSDRTHFFASHPASGERARTLEAWLPEAHMVRSGKRP